jgi:beta-ribofuranosylaminobenzene 5'-phosphate synthase
VTVETGARLHFGLVDLTGDLGRVDGSLGVALTKPRLVIRASPADRLTTNMFPELARLALERLNEHYGLRKGLNVEVLEWYPQHVGLGSTTQTLLSVAAAYNALYDQNASVRELASVVGRGGTSGIGVAAFETGGFILDAGHTFGLGKQKQRFLPSSGSTAPPPPVLFRADLPDDWVFDVIVPQSTPGLFGKHEASFFQDNCPVDPRATCRIAHVILSSILPAVVEREITTFARGINLLATLGFKTKEINRQSQQVKQLIRTINKVTARQSAVGMSSFGPTLFIISDKKTRTGYIDRITATLRGLMPSLPVHHYEAVCRNRGATVVAV